MKVLHVISSGGMYGAEAVILDLSRALHRMGHGSEIAVFANSALPNAELETRARTCNIRTHGIPCTGQLDRSVPAQLRHLVRTQGFDVVHAHGYKADVYAFWAMHATGIPTIATCHNWVDGNLTLRLYGRVDRFVLKRFAAVAAVSDGVRQRLIGAGVPPERVRCIRNGVDLTELSHIERTNDTASGHIRIGIVARLSPEKGVDLFLRAAAIVAQARPETRFFVAGEGPERANLEQCIADLELQDRALLLGRQDDMPAFYRQLDLLVLSSRYEGLPMALLEGMASGLPVVATAVGEVPEVIGQGKVGKVVAVEDVSAIASATLELIRDRDRLREMGARARARITAEYSADRMAAEYLNLYTSVGSDPMRQTGRDGSA